MRPELFEIPLIHLTVKSHGLMIVIGFLAALAVVRRLSRPFTPDARIVTNGALYALIAGVLGARIFYVLHYFDQFRDEPLSIFAFWRGGLELYGAVLAVIAVVFYLVRHKLPVRRYLDTVAVGLMLAVAFGRIGCLLNGCCFGKPTSLPWAIRFPYDSFAYQSQTSPDPQRNRPEPYLRLPRDYLTVYAGGRTLPKPYDLLTPAQQEAVTSGPYRCLPVHPTQIYSSLNGAILCLLLYLFWRRAQNATQSRERRKLLAAPGQTFAIMFVLYGITRFFLEMLRDDNPFEQAWWALCKGRTVSQNISVALVLFGVVLAAVFQFTAPRRKVSPDQQ